MAAAWIFISMLENLKRKKKCLLNRQSWAMIMCFVLLGVVGRWLNDMKFPNKKLGGRRVVWGFDNLMITVHKLNWVESCSKKVQWTFKTGRALLFSLAGDVTLVQASFKPNTSRYYLSFLFSKSLWGFLKGLKRLWGDFFS